MDINDFNYRETPTKKTRQYEVHPLSPDGVDQYLDKNSQLHKFLKSPTILHTNSLKNNNTGLNFHDYYSIQRPMEEDCKHYHRKRDVISLNRDILKKKMYNQISQKPNKSVIDEENYMSPQQEKYSNPYEEQKNFNENEEKQNYDIGNYDPKRSSFEPIPNFDYSNKNPKSFLQTSKNLIVGSPRFSMPKVGKSTFYNNYKYNEGYTNPLTLFKSSFNSQDFENKMTKNLTNSGNFKSFEHLNNNRSSSNFRVRNNLEKTLSNGQNQEKNPLRISKMKLMNNKIM